MKRSCILIVLSLLILTSCGGGPRFKLVDGRYIDKEYNIQFKEIGGSWEKEDPGVARKHGTIHYFFDKEDHARIWVRATRYENDPALPLKEGADSYVERKAKQYSWTDLKVVAEDYARLNGEKSYWKIYAYKLGSKEKKEKIYRVYHEKVAYQFRLRCAAERFDQLLPEFDAWLETIEFLK